MPTYLDLEPLPLFGPQCTSVLAAVGWLGHEGTFPRGAVAPAFFARLRERMAHRFEPIASAGVHVCHLCQFDGPAGNGILFVPDGTRLLACPELIVHFIAAHHYQPPLVCQSAVQCCPDPRGQDYRKLFLAAGGRVLLASST